MVPRIEAYVDGRPIPSSSSCLHQARLGEARRRRGRVRHRLEARPRSAPAFSSTRGSRVSRSSRSVGVVVGLLDVGTQEAGGTWMTLPLAENSTSSPARRRAAHPHRDGATDGVGHLGGRPCAARSARTGGARRCSSSARTDAGVRNAVTGRPDRLVRLLGVLDLAVVLPRRVGHVVRCRTARGPGPGRRSARSADNVVESVRI